MRKVKLSDKRPVKVIEYYEPDEDRKLEIIFYLIEEHMYRHWINEEHRWIPIIILKEVYRCLVRVVETVKGTTRHEGYITAPITYKRGKARQKIRSFARAWEITYAAYESWQGYTVEEIIEKCGIGFDHRLENPYGDGYIRDRELDRLANKLYDMAGELVVDHDALAKFPLPTRTRYVVEELEE